MPNVLTVRSVRTEPRVIEAAGGRVTVAFEAQVSSVDAKANVTIEVEVAMPYKVMLGGSSVHMIPRAGATIRQPVAIQRTSANPAMSNIILRIKVGIAGETQRHSCFVYIGDPIGVQLKAVRSKRGDSQQALADEIEMSRSVISRAERGLGLSPETEAKIARLLK